MERNVPRFDRQLMLSHTQLAKARVEETLKRARNIEEDTQREARVERQFCKACHYFSRIAAQAFTTQPCACCGVPQTYSSSATDVLCMDCAQSHDLCKHCGGDLEMHTGRQNWPSARSACSSTSDWQPAGARSAAFDAPIHPFSKAHYRKRSPRAPCLNDSTASY